MAIDSNGALAQPPPVASPSPSAHSETTQANTSGAGFPVTVYSTQPVEYHPHGDELLVGGIEELSKVALDKAWSGATFAPGHCANGTAPCGEVSHYRSLKTFQAANVMALDVDQGTPLEVAEQRLRESGLRGFIGTTKSHQLEKRLGNGTVAPACARYRIVVETEPSITSRAQYEATWRALVAELGLDTVDQAPKDPSRFWQPCKRITLLTQGKPFRPVVEQPKAAYNSPPMGPLEERLKRARAFLAKVPPAIEGNGGDQQTFCAALILVKGFALSEEEALPLFEDYNARCIPPWGDEKLRRKLHEAARSRCATGYLLSHAAASRGTDNWVELQLFRTASQVLAEPCSPPRFLVRPYIPEQSLVLLQGEPGCGKTWLALDLAVKAARVGHRVAYLTEEGTLGTLQDRLRALGADEDFGEGSIRVSHPQGFRLDETPWMDKVIDELVCNAIEFVILDPLADLHALDENSQAEMFRVRDALKRLRQETGAAVLVCHHTTKGSWQGRIERRGPSLADGRGSGLLAGSSDVVLNISPSQRGAPGQVRAWVTLLKTKNLPGLPEKQLFEVFSMPDARVECQLSSEADAESATQVERQEELDSKILVALPMLGEGQGLSKSAVFRAVKGTKGKVLGRIDALVESGHIHIEKNGRTTLCWVSQSVRESVVPSGNRTTELPHETPWPTRRLSVRDQFEAESNRGSTFVDAEADGRAMSLTRSSAPAEFSTSQPEPSR